LKVSFLHTKEEQQYEGLQKRQNLEVEVKRDKGRKIQRGSIEKRKRHVKKRVRIKKVE
jgi:hypothetical protein